MTKLQAEWADAPPMQMAKAPEATETRRRLGQMGEQVACRYLERSGYVVMARNTRVSRLEIDIIARDKRNGTLVFCEVKTRQKSHLHPAVSITSKKKTHMVRAGKRWLSNNPAHRRSRHRFDVITVIVDKDRFVIEHYRNLRFGSIGGALY